ncbi:hypothetical protein ASD08_46085 [Streptomyces sp. Root369]|nr:hypothetical protein ASD08_46085 [Streptomyces sp. Root369]
MWEIAKPLIPPSRLRSQVGGTRDTPDEALFAAIVQVLADGCAGRRLPLCSGLSKPTARRRFPIWSRAGHSRPHAAVLGRLDEADLIDVTRFVLDTARFSANSQPHPVDRGNGVPGSTSCRT